MGIIGGLDVHRSQITYDWIDTDSGQRQRGRLAPAHREHLRVWLGQFAGQEAAFALVIGGGVEVRGFEPLASSVRASWG